MPADPDIQRLLDLVFSRHPALKPKDWAELAGKLIGIGGTSSPAFTTLLPSLTPWRPGPTN
jgi:hypothetical protein